MIPTLVRGFIATMAGIASAGGSGPASRVVFDEVVSDGYFHSTAAFVTNDEAERAWVEVAVDNGGVGDDYRFDTFRIRVADLSYDTATREVLYQNEGTRVACARLTISKFLFTTRMRIKSTGRCELLSRIEHRNDDTGFEYETHKHLVVELSVTPQP